MHQTSAEGAAALLFNHRLMHHPHPTPITRPILLGLCVACKCTCTVGLLMSHALPITVCVHMYFGQD
eukprot:364869-Chlamydomonas_euryale.AAC.12